MLQKTNINITKLIMYLDKGIKIQRYCMFGITQNKQQQQQKL